MHPAWFCGARRFTAIPVLCLTMLSLPAGAQAPYPAKPAAQALPPAHTLVRAKLRVTVLAAGESVESGTVLPQDALPDTHVGRGKRDIAEAWLVEPTTRYAHAVLGDAVEAGGVRVRSREGRVYTYRLPEDSVFEDLYARVIDIDGDGRDEVLVVRSRQASGSSLMALGLRNGALVPVAESAPIGTRHRWLNPVGVADVNANGKLELLAVHTPHIGGVLVVYRLEDNRLVETHRMPGFSNHVIGSRALGLSAFIDVDGDGYPEVILPSADRRELRAISLAHGSPFEVARINLPSPAWGDFETRLPYGLVVPLQDGRRAFVSWR